MDEQKETTRFAASLFSEIVSKQGFSPAAIKETDWVTKINFSHASGIGLEVELDWRDKEVFVLLVKLSNGASPKGYYVENGLPCRKHLFKVVMEQDWPGAKENSEEGPDHGGTSSMRTSLQREASLLEKNISRLIKKGQSIF